MSPTSAFLAPTRDEGLRLGRAKIGGGDSFYALPGVTANAVGTVSSTAGQDCYSFLYVLSPMMIDQLVFYVSTFQAASNIRVGLYRADQNWQPKGPPLVDSGDIATTSNSLKTYTPSVPFLLRPGRYLTVWNEDTSAVVLETVRGLTPFGGAYADEGSAPNSWIQRCFVSRAHAAFPTPGTAWTSATTSGSNPMEYAIFLRVLST